MKTTGCGTGYAKQKNVMVSLVATIMFFHVLADFDSQQGTDVLTVPVAGISSDFANHCSCSSLKDVDAFCPIA